MQASRKKRTASKNDDVKTKMRDITGAREKAISKKTDTTIFFSDLCDSTSYKIQRDPITALGKTYLHNEIITDIVVKHSGIVVKYIGDEVMATFDGDDGPIRALRAAAECQTALHEHNDTADLKDLDKLRTKTAVHAGPVFNFKFEGHESSDPQGLTVDVAARLNALAKPEQILCSHEVMHKCADQNFKFAPSVSRELKGVREPVKITEFQVPGKQLLGIRETGHYSVPDALTDQLLKSAREAMNRGSYKAAIDEFKNVLTSDDKHFVANIMLSEIYLRIYYDSKSAYEHAKRASESNPESALARHHISTMPWHLKREGSKLENDSYDIEKMIEETSFALDSAQRNTDFHAEFLSVNSLAYLAAEKYEESNEEEYLKMALEYCEALDNRYMAMHSGYLAAFFDTYAFVLCQKGDEESLKLAMEKADESQKLAPNVPYPRETQAKILRKMKELERKSRK